MIDKKNKTRLSIIVDNKKNIKIKGLIYLSIIIIVPLGVFFYPQDENDLQIILLFIIPFVLWFMAIIYARHRFKSYKIIGYLCVKNDELWITDNTLTFKDVKIIKITYNKYYGENLNLTGTAISQGDNNEIFILTKDRKQYRLRIFLKDKRSLGELKRFASILIKNEVNVIFYEGRKKIYP